MFFVFSFFFEDAHAYPWLFYFHQLFWQIYVLL